MQEKSTHRARGVHPNPLGPKQIDHLTALCLLLVPSPRLPSHEKTDDGSGKKEDSPQGLVPERFIVLGKNMEQEEDAGEDEQNTDNRTPHASIMLKQGVHPKIVQERLEHSNIAITLDTYSHVTAGLQEAAAKSFDQAFLLSYNDTANKSAHS